MSRSFTPYKHHRPKELKHAKFKPCSNVNDTKHCVASFLLNIILQNVYNRQEEQEKLTTPHDYVCKYSNNSSVSRLPLDKLR